MRAPRSKVLLTVAAACAALWVAAPVAAVAAPAPAPAPSATPATPATAPSDATKTTGGGMNDVSCPTAQFCVAVGVENFTNPYVNQRLILEMRRGSQWSRVTDLGTFPDRDFAPLGVSCTSASFCAVVLYGRRAELAPISLIWNGSTWQSTGMPNPGGDFVNLPNGVSCVSASFCLTVGATSTADGFRPFAQRWDGSSWTLQPVPAYPVAGTREVSLEDVSCASPVACTAVGSRRTGNVRGTGVVARFDGSAWSWVPAAETAAGEDVYLYGVSCRTATTCVAVGTASEQEFLLVRQGAGWTRRNVTVSGTLIQPDVSCPAGTTACLVVGRHYEPGNEHADAVAQLVAASGAVQVVSPRPLRTSSGFTGVSCTTISVCTAVGFTGGDTSPGYLTNTLAESWNGTVWARQST